MAWSKGSFLAPSRTGHAHQLTVLPLSWDFPVSDISEAGILFSSALETLGVILEGQNHSRCHDSHTVEIKPVVYYVHMHFVSSYSHFSVSCPLHTCNHSHDERVL